MPKSGDLCKKATASSVARKQIIEEMLLSNLAATTAETERMLLTGAGGAGGGGGTGGMIVDSEADNLKEALRKLDERRRRVESRPREALFCMRCVETYSLTAAGAGGGGGACPSAPAPGTVSHEALIGK